MGVLKPCYLAIAHRSLVQRAPCESAVLQFRPREVNCKITAADCVTFIGVPHDGRCFAPFRSVGSRFPQLIVGSEGDQTSQPRRTGVTDLHAAFTCDRGAVRSAARAACLRSSSLAIGCGAPHPDDAYCACDRVGPGEAEVVGHAGPAVRPDGKVDDLTQHIRRPVFAQKPVRSQSAVTRDRDGRSCLEICPFSERSP